MRVTLKLTLDNMSDYGAPYPAVMEALADLLDGEILEAECYNPYNDEYAISKYAKYQICVTDAARNTDRKKTP